LYIVPDWPAPERVRAFTTTRIGGASGGPYAGFNLADHVGDDPAQVRANRARLCQAAGLPSEPRWLRQVHGTDVVDAVAADPGTTADGSVTEASATVCAVLTADCLPVFLCDRRGTTVGVLHAGWRGLAAGIVEAGVARMDLPGAALLAWLGPAIGPAAFEVGDDVRDAFVREDAAAAGAFVPNARGRWLADLYALARRRLAGVGVTAIYGGEHCTVTQADLFYSYRRDGATGRMASVIWLA
jgi:YfiH family protein